MKKSKIEKQLLIAKLISTSYHRVLTLPEQSQLSAWLNENESNKKLYLKLTDEKIFPDYIEQINNINLIDAKIKIHKKVKKGKISKLIKISLKYAAILILVLGSAYFFIPSQNSMHSSSELKIKKEIITLQLDNGDIKTINTNEKSNVLDNMGRIVGIQSGSYLKYSKNISTDKIIYNVLSIPYGEKFKLELSDGTLVHLNSGSSLRYPVKFLSGHERIVFIKGEAYFEVKEDKTSPFIVQSNNVNIRVLGTKFNISSYEEDNLLNTVLVEGSIRLFLPNEEYSESNSTLLNPGHMASWNKSDNQFKFKEVDTRIHTAWTKGKLVFKNTPFSSIRKKLERHYNVTIINNNKKLDDKMYNATFDIETIEQVMKSFNENFSINYTIIKNKIIIN